MASSSLSDPASSINPSCVCAGSSSLSLGDLEDFIEDHHSKLKALISVALTHGLQEWTEGTQYHYWMLLDEQVMHVAAGVEQLCIQKNARS
jgi:hypothetical protein